MAKKKTAKKKGDARIGRPPTGPDGGRVRDLAIFSLRLPPNLKADLESAASVLERPKWRIVVEALEQYLADLPPKVRREIARARDLK